jgi:hypothetical protein
VKSKEQMTEPQQSSGGGGIGGMLGRKLMKKDAPKPRSTVFTTNHLFVDIAKSVDAADLAIPADFKEKK